MEIENLKNTWQDLDHQLKENLILKENIVKEILHSKTTKALSRLINFETLCTAIVFMVIPFMVFTLKHLKMVQIQRYFIIGCIALVSIGCLCQIWKLYMLMKIDLTNAIGYNIRLIQRYNIQIKREKIFTVIVLPIIMMMAIIPVIRFNIEAWRWAAIISICCITILICVWQYKRFYKTNIRSIFQSMDELRELEEDSQS